MKTRKPSPTPEPCAHGDTRSIALRNGTLLECRTCGRVLDPEPTRGATK